VSAYGKEEDLYKTEIRCYNMVRELQKRSVANE